MESIVGNHPQVFSIFRHLILHPELHDEFNFNYVYFKDNTITGDFLSELYRRVRRMIHNSESNSYEYNSDMLLFAWFVFSPEKTDETLYYDKIKGNITGKAFDDEYDKIKETIESIYLTSTKMGQIMTDEYLTDLVESYVIESSLNNQFADLREYIALSNINHDLTIKDFYKGLKEIQEKNDKKYAIPNRIKSSNFLDMFDPRLMGSLEDTIYDSGIYHLNQTLVKGFHAQTVTGFITKTGGGKSTIMFTLACEALKKGFNVAYVNLEMENKVVNARFMGYLSEKYTVNDILTNLGNNETMQDLKQELDCMNLGKLALISSCDCDREPTVKWMEEQIEKCEKIVRRETGNEDFKYDIIFIDYLYLLRPSRSMNKNIRSDEEYREITKEVHQYAQRADKAVITVYQSNRLGESKLSENKQITLSEVGDSYAAMRDIEYIYAISKPKEEDKDGIVVSCLKSRHYDGDYISFFIRYDKSKSGYNCKYSELYEYSEDEVDVKNKGRKLKYDITAEDVLLSNPDLHNKVPNGSLTIVLPKCDVSKCSKRYIDEIYQHNGWKTLTKDDFPDMNYDDAQRWIEEAVQIAKDIKANKQTTNSKVIISDNPEDLFRI